MAANKRYYWLKMKKSFWDEPSVLFLRNLPNGDTIVIIYLKMLCMSLQNNGIIYLEGNAAVTNGNTEIEKEIEKDKDTEIEEELDRGLGLYQNVFLYPEEFQNLKAQYPADYMQKINNLSVYMVSAKKNYQSHYMTICRWAREDAKREKSSNNGYKPRLITEMDYS